MYKCANLFNLLSNSGIMKGTMNAKQRYAKNNLEVNKKAIVMYLDMNSFFASCEQQDNPALRGKPMGVVTYDSPNACVIAPSIEAKKHGVKTGMRLSDCKMLCPQIIPVLGRPQRYRDYHVRIMEVLSNYCDDVIPRSIDEALMNFTTYRNIYSDFHEVARQIKADLLKKCGEFVKCSIGIAPNSFLAKLATEIQKPDGLIEITPENIDEHLSKMKLTDLPGIARANEARLKMIGIETPLKMRHSSEALLRRAFGGIVGNYWYKRLNFMEVDLVRNPYRGMSAGRTVSRQQREDPQALDSMLISLCTRLEQRMVKQQVCCREVTFDIRYKNGTKWDTKIRLATPSQDAMEIRSYIQQKMQEFAQQRNTPLFNSNLQHMVVAISNFIEMSHVQYGLFDNRMRQDKVRKAMYNIKDDFGKNSVRKASETIQHKVMADAIGFGSVKDLYSGGNFNHYLLEEDSLGAKNKRTPREAVTETDDIDWDANQDTEALMQYAQQKLEREQQKQQQRNVAKVQYKSVDYYDAWE